MAPVRVLIADDQADVRSALRLLLEQEFGDQVEVSEVSDISRLSAAVRAAEPTLILLDWELPGLRQAGLLNTCCSASRLIAEMRGASPEVRVVVLSGRCESHDAAISSGADAFVCKADSPEELLATVQRALAGPNPRPHCPR